MNEIESLRQQLAEQAEAIDLQLHTNRRIVQLEQQMALLRGVVEGAMQIISLEGTPYYLLGIEERDDALAALERKMTAEQKARDLIERMGVPDAQEYSAGELVELANLIVSADTPVALAEAYRCGKEAGDAEIAELRKQLAAAQAREALLCSKCNGYIAYSARLTDKIESLEQQLAEAQAEINEQARTIGMGGQREIALRRQVTLLRDALKYHQSQTDALIITKPKTRQWRQCG